MGNRQLPADVQLTNLHTPSGGGNLLVLGLLYVVKFRPGAQGNAASPAPWLDARFPRNADHEHRYRSQMYPSDGTWK